MTTKFETISHIFSHQVGYCFKFSWSISEVQNFKKKRNVAIIAVDFRPILQLQANSLILVHCAMLSKLTCCVCALTTEAAAAANGKTKRESSGDQFRKPSRHYWANCKRAGVKGHARPRWPARAYFQSCSINERDDNRTNAPAKRRPTCLPDCMRTSSRKP